MLYLSLLLTLAVPALAAVHEKLEALPRGWQKLADALPEDQTIQLHVALQYSNIDRLEEKLLSVSDPSSSAYGQYLEPHELNDIFAPSQDREDRVTSWLQSHPDVQVIARDGNTVSFATTVARANQILDASFGLYSDGHATKLGTMSYSVPDHLVDDIDLIMPTTYFGYPKRVKPSRQQELHSEHRLEQRSTHNIPSCDHIHTIPPGFKAPYGSSECYKEVYNLGNYTPSAKAGSNIAFSSFFNFAANYADLEKFESQFGIPHRNFSILGLLHGAHNEQRFANSIEGNLDSQTIISLVGDLPVGEYISKGTPVFIPTLMYEKNIQDVEPFLQFYQYLLSLSSKELPWVISNSYADFENNVPRRYAVRTCNIIGMLGMRGRTILAPAGDSGPGEVCLSASGKKQFTPMFPPDCPWVTGVGGTQDTKPVVACTYGGGGFSDFFTIPSYQKNAVSTYLSKYIDPAAKKYFTTNGYANFSGRGIPDISANFGPPYLPVVFNGSLAPGGGTSESSPIVASIFALLNDARFREGKPALGFVNPWLYQLGAEKGIVDVKHGQSVGCPPPGASMLPKGTPNISYATWNATEGWDPVTGVGYPNFLEMVGMT